MTRPHADTDPWLTDPISRDRVIAKTVVEGMRTIISQLRAIREEISESRAYREENLLLRGRIGDLEDRIGRLETNGAVGIRRRARGYSPCIIEECSLPLGHMGNHRGSMVASQ